jgi:hypothetical protein
LHKEVQRHWRLGKIGRFSFGFAFAVLGVMKLAPDSLGAQTAQFLAVAGFLGIACGTLAVAYGDRLLDLLTKILWWISH